MHTDKRLFFACHIITITVCLFISSCNSKSAVSLIIHHARIYTVDSSFSIAEAMAINDGKIIETGSNETILNKYQSDSVTDAAGKNNIPRIH